MALGVAAILIFGPERLPGMIRKAGEYYAQLQSVAHTFRQELESEVGEVTGPLKEAAADISSAGRDIADTGREVSELAIEAGQPDEAVEAVVEEQPTADPSPTPADVTATDDKETGTAG